MIVAIVSKVLLGILKLSWMIQYWTRYRITVGKLVNALEHRLTLCVLRA